MSENKRKKELHLTLTPELVIRVIAIVVLIGLMAFLMIHKI